MRQDQSPQLGKVYGAQSPDELKNAYDGWAEAYDRETLALGYCTPFVVLAWLARHQPANAGEVMDAGCGTGLSGPLLGAMGYKPLCGLDFSQDMLRAVAAREVYEELVQAELGKALPFQSGRFAAIICAGVFTLGHAPAAAFHELTRVLKPGGHIVFSLRDSTEETTAFRDILEDLTGRQVWRRVEVSEPFRSFLLAEPGTFVRVHAYRKC
jgi:predicted TPR repeat methyltransferase